MSFEVIYNMLVSCWGIQLLADSKYLTDPNIYIFIFLVSKDAIQLIIDSKGSIYNITKDFCYEMYYEIINIT